MPKIWQKIKKILKPISPWQLPKPGFWVPNPSLIYRQTIYPAFAINNNSKVSWRLIVYPICIFVMPYPYLPVDITVGQKCKKIAPKLKCLYDVVACKISRIRAQIVYFIEGRKPSRHKCMFLHLAGVLIGAILLRYVSFFKVTA